MKLKIIDKVKDCPPCRHVRIEFEYETGISGGRGWETQTWVARCEHWPVCKLRMEKAK